MAPALESRHPPKRPGCCSWLLAVAWSALAAARQLESEPVKAETVSVSLSLCYLTFHIKRLKIIHAYSQTLHQQGEKKKTKQTSLEKSHRVI